MILNKNYVIVINTKADIAVCHAAEQLKYYLDKICDLVLPIVTDNNEYENEIIVGKCKRNLVDKLKVNKLRNDGYAYEISQNKLQITSNTSRGVLYGVFSFLEDELGCRYFVKDDFYIPKILNLQLNEKIVQYIPQFMYRDFCDNSCHNPDYAVANKINGIYYNLDEKRGKFFEIGGHCHTLPVLFNPDELFDEHPEYFALIDGKRKKSPSQLCFTNPCLVPIAVEKILKWKRERPDLNIFTISQADGYHFCTCDKCKKVYERENAYSGTLIEFINSVARETRKHYPDIVIDTLAYLHNRRPPKYLKLEKNVQIRLCSIECCEMHLLGSCSFLSSKHFEIEKSYPPEEYSKNAKAWGKLTDKLFIWDYPCNTNHTLLPVPNFTTIKPNLKQHVQNNVKGVFINASYLAQYSSFSQLRGYLYAKCMWNPDCDISKHYNEFMGFYYGKASEKMKEVIAYLEKRAKEKDLHSIFASHVNLNYFDREFMDKYDILLTEAEKLADNEKILNRIQREHLTISMLELVYLDGNNEEFDDKLNEFFKKGHSLGITVFKEMEPLLSEKLYRYVLKKKDWYFDKFEEFAKENC